MAAVPTPVGIQNSAYRPPCVLPAQRRIPALLSAVIPSHSVSCTPTWYGSPQSSPAALNSQPCMVSFALTRQVHNCNVVLCCQISTVLVCFHLEFIGLSGRYCSAGSDLILGECDSWQDWHD